MLTKYCWKRYAVMPTLLAGVLSLTLWQTTFAADPPKTVTAPDEYAPVMAKDMASVTRLRAVIVRRKADAAKRQAVRDRAYTLAVAKAKREKKPFPAKPAKIKAATNYLEAYLYDLEQRAFPNDSIDLDAVYDAGEERDAMRVYRGIAARINGGERSKMPRVPVPPTTWSYVGPRNLTTPYQIYYGPAASATSGRVNGLAFHPTNSDIAYLAAGGGGVWKTGDGGANWTSVSGGFPSQNTGCIAVHPVNGNIVYAGLGDFNGNRGDGGGVMKSTDGGANWTRLDASHSDFVRSRISALEIDPDNPEKIVASTGKSSPAARIFLSTNGGTSWTGVGTIGGTYSDIEISPVRTPNTDATFPDARFYYAANQTNDAVYRSTSDTVATIWTSINLPTTFIGYIEISTSPTNGNVIYLSNSGAYDNVTETLRGRGLYKGIRDPATDTYAWTTIMDGFPGGQPVSATYNWSQSFYDHHLTAVGQKIGAGDANNSDFLYSSLITIAAKRGANDWQDVGETYTWNARTHNDNHAFAAFPADKNKLLVGNDGGIYGLTYSPATGTFTFNDRLSATLGITMFYHADFHPSNPTWIIGGTQDNATPVARGDVANWANEGGGDGGGVAINPLIPTRQYTTSQNGGFYITANQWGGTGEYDLPLITVGGRQVNDGAFVSRLAIDPNAPNPVYYGGRNYLHRFDVSPIGSTGAWQTQVGGLDFGSQLLAITVAPTDSRVIYVGTTGGALYRSTNYGETWTLINGTLPNRARTDIWVNPKNAADVIVTLSGSGTGRVYRSANALDAAPTWTNISGTGAGALPNTPTNSVTRDPFDKTGATFYVGTDVGVFATSDGGANWTNATAPLGLPNVSVRTLRAIAGTGYLMASTYGRGIWRIPLTANVPDLQPDLRITQSQTRVSGTVRYTITVTNLGGATATALRLTSALLRVGTTTTPTTTVLPLVFTNTAPGASSSATVIFPNTVGAAGTSARLTIGGSYSFGAQTGTFGGTSRVTLP